MIGTTLTLMPLAAKLAIACTRILTNGQNSPVIAGRTMDWPETTQPKLYVLPAGMARNGGRLGPHSVIAENPARWQSRYGSVVAAAYDLAAVDGLNERGLAGHLLYLTSTDYGPRDATKPGLHAGLWLQYLLDNAASVPEALALLETVQIVMVEAHGHKASVHLALEDATGDSAIVEYTEGRQVIHHGPQYKVMTNDPPYDEQLALLRQMEADQAFTQPSRDTPLPGNMNPTHRFLRAAFFSRFLPAPQNIRQAVAAMFSLLANVSVPFGAPYKNFGIYNTEYRSVTDLSALIYFFQLTTVPSVCWTHLSRLNLKPGAPALVLDPDGLDIAGDVTEKYIPVTAPF